MVVMAAAELELDAMAACAEFSTTIVPRCGRSDSMCLGLPACLPVPARPPAFLYQVPRLQWCQLLLLPARQHSVTCLSLSLPFSPFDTTPCVQLPPRA